MSFVESKHVCRKLMNPAIDDRSKGPELGRHGIFVDGLPDSSVYSWRNPTLYL